MVCHVKHSLRPGLAYHKSNPEQRQYEWFVCIYPHLFKKIKTNHGSRISSANSTATVQLKKKKFKNQKVWKY